MTPQLPKVSRDKLSQEVAEAVRWMIIEGKITHGERLIEEAISEETGVSRGTVREAIMRLSSEGLAIVEPYKGATVTGMSPEEFAEVIIPVRWTLERYAIKRALERIDSRSLTHLGSVVDQMYAEAERQESISVRRMVELDVDFHRTLIEASDSLQTEQLWHAIQPRIQMGFYRLSTSQPHPSLIADEHRRLLSLITAGDLNAVLEELEDHIVHSPRGLLGLKADVSGSDIA